MEKSVVGTVHRLALREQFVRPVLEGRMRYQVREADRCFQDGDTVTFYVVTLKGQPLSSAALTYCDYEEVATVESRRYRINCVSAFPGLAPGFVAFSISELDS